MKKYQNQTILICWEHKRIPKIVEALGAKNVAQWPYHVFDQTYLLTFEEGNPTPQVKLYLQRLMYGDR